MDILFIPPITLCLILLLSIISLFCIDLAKYYYSCYKYEKELESRKQYFYFKGRSGN